MIRPTTNWDFTPRLAHYEKNIYIARALQRRKIADRFMATIRSKDIADSIKEREAEGVTGNTIRIDLAMLSRLFNIAISDWGMESPSNPVARVSKPKLPKGRERRLEEDEEERLLAATNLEMQFIRGCQIFCVNEKFLKMWASYFRTKWRSNSGPISSL